MINNIPEKIVTAFGIVVGIFIFGILAANTSIFAAVILIGYIEILLN